MERKVMSSTYRHHVVQDSEKENPLNLPLKEKTLLGGTGKTLHSLIGSTASASFKDVKQQQQQQQQGRANFTMLNNNTAKNVRNVMGSNLNHRGDSIAVNNQKIAFRELSNVNNAKIENGSNYNDNRKAAIKSTVLPVEQFKTFSVYEDENDGFVETTTTSVKTIFKTTKIDVSNAANVNKENELYDEKLQKVEQQPQDVQTNTKVVLNERSDLAVLKYEYTTNTTPMSISETLSPMSVDRSTLTSQSFKDDSDTHEIADGTLDDNSKEPLQLLLRNSRQRFFEVVEYQQDILEYFRETEKKRRPKPHYMSRQNDINNSMRTILIDWLVEVSEEYNLDSETLYLSVSYIDRFLSHMSVVRNKLQLVGTAAMYIASKYEEIYPPDVGEFVFITDDTYTKAQVLRMEQIILKILSFDLCTPTAYAYINTYAVLIDIVDRVKYLSMYICELSLLEADPYLRFYPSIVSAAALALARYTCNYPIWSRELEDITTYRLEDMKEVFLSLSKSHTNAETLAQHAVREKYKAEKYCSVSSSITPVTITEDQFDTIVKKYNEMQKGFIQKNELEARLQLTDHSIFKF